MIGLEDQAPAQPGPLAPRRHIAGPLDLFRLIFDCPLAGGVKFLALALLRHADRDTWSWPRVPQSASQTAYGVSVPTLAEEIDVDERTVRRLRATLEQRGLVTVYPRAGRTNGYRIELEAWLDYAQRFDAEAERKTAREAEERQREATSAWLESQGRTEEAAAVRAAPSLVEPRSMSPAGAAGDAPRAPSMPRWAHQAVRGTGTSAQEAYAVVAALLELVGAEDDAERLGRVARAILRTWRSRAYPEPAVFRAEAALLLRAAEEAPAYLWHELRERGVGDGTSRLRDLRLVLTPGKYAERLQAAAKWAEEVGPPASPGAAPVRALVTAGAVSWAASELSERWEAILEDLEARVDPTTVAIWLRYPVEHLALEDGVLWLEVPGRVYVDWIEANYLRVLAELAGGSVGVRATGPPSG